MLMSSKPTQQYCTIVQHYSIICRALIKEVTEIKECQQMMHETIQAKDNVIMALSSQIENMQKDMNPSHIPVSEDIIDFAEPYHDSLKVRHNYVLLFIYSL